MHGRIAGALSYANVATVAVFIALGGSAYAAVQLGRNGVEAHYADSAAMPIGSF